MSEFVLMKRGLYWRPDACGYTGVLAEAGRYTEAEAKARIHPDSPAVTAHRIEDCAEFSPACWPETQIAVLRAENARLRIALHDAIRRPLGVTPDSAEEFYDVRMAVEAEERRSPVGVSVGVERYGNPHNATIPKT